jgi:hypothetical protein
MKQMALLMLNGCNVQRLCSSGCEQWTCGIAGLCSADSNTQAEAKDFEYGIGKSHLSVAF